MGPRIWSALALGSALTLWAPAARAQTPRAPPTDLVYSRGHWTQACGDVGAIKRVAIRELGYDPFDEAAARKLRVSIGWRAGKLTADLGLWDEAGRNVWENVIETTSPCPTLVAAVGWSIALRLQPRPEPEKPAPVACPVCAACSGVEAQKPAPACEAAPEPLPPPLVPPVATPTPPEVNDALSFRMGAMAWGGQVTTDRAAVGGSIDLGIRYKWFGGAIEGRGDPPLGARPIAGGATANYGRAAGALLWCVFYEWFVGCAKGEAARILFLGNVHPSTYGYGAVGVRLGLDFPVVPRRFFVRVAGELLGPIDPPPILTFQNASVIQIAGTTLELGVGVLFALDEVRPTTR